MVVKLLMGTLIINVIHHKCMQHICTVSSKIINLKNLVIKMLGLKVVYTFHVTLFVVKSKATAG